MMSKPKKCKGTGSAKGYGCGNPSIYRKYGLCPSCLSDFMFNTPEGKLLLQKTTRAAKRDVEKINRRNHTSDKQSIKKRSAFEQDLQTEVNAIVRLIDTEKGCISCQHGWSMPWSRQRHAGHRLSVGSDPTLRYHLDNIFVQCSICNTHLSSNAREYDKGLILHYGDDAVDKLSHLKERFKSIHLSIADLQDKIRIARIIKRAILKGECYDRDRANRELSIYSNTIT